MKYTLDTDFSVLNGPKAKNWVLHFRESAEEAFRDRGMSSWLLGNLLMLESYVHTLRQGLAARGRQPAAMVPYALDRLWDCLEGRTAPADWQDFANNLWAATLCYNVGEEISEAQAEFYRRNFEDVNDCTYEWQILTWCATLFMYLVADAGGRLDFEEFEVDELGVQADFYGVDEMLSMLGDACVKLTNTPCPSYRANDVEKAMELVYQTPLFRQLVSLIQGALKTALTAAPEQYGALRAEYQSKGVLPEEYAAGLLSF